jgi:hypothetical protein
MHSSIAIGTLRGMWEETAVSNCKTLFLHFPKRDSEIS